MVKEVTPERLRNCLSKFVYTTCLLIMYARTDISFSLDRGYGIKEMASYFGYATRTIERKLNHFGIRIRQHLYSLISETKS